MLDALKRCALPQPFRVEVVDVDLNEALTLLLLFERASLADVLIAREALEPTGARHLVLVGRRAPSPEARTTLAELEAHGATVQVVSLDISDLDAVRGLFARDSSRPNAG